LEQQLTQAVALAAAGRQAAVGAPAAAAAAPGAKAKQRMVLLHDTEFDANFAAPPREARGAAPPSRPPVGGGGLVETERDSLIRRGIITPFASLEGFERRVHASVANTVASAQARALSRPRTMLMEANQLPRLAAQPREYVTPSASAQRRAHGEQAGRAALKRRRAEHRLAMSAAAAGGADDQADDADAQPEAAEVTVPKKKARAARSSGGGASDEEAGAPGGIPDAVDDDAEPSASDGEAPPGSDTSNDADMDYVPLQRRTRAGGAKKPAKGRRRRRAPLVLDSDGDADDAQEPADDAPAAAPGGAEPDGSDDDAYDAEEDDVLFDGGFTVPGRMHGRLFDYQRTALQWLWELHCQRCGGIIGDEMGMGKTVQVVAFLGSLHASGMYHPSLVICPATMLRQWQREIEAWYPGLEASIMHDSGVTSDAVSSRKARERMISHVASSSDGILLTTYEHVRLFAPQLLAMQWGYAILDEGHKIRNPDAEITQLCKQLRTVHRIIMTGAPIQNRLTELWSLFDFVFPGKLGTLPVFTQQFTVPITIGGYSNASGLQVSTAFRCAVVLRDLIAPYLLRRLKSDVSLKLPKKTEHVLFCPLTKVQIDAYRAYIASKDVAAILEGDREALAGIDVLRKIVNHPDLLDRARAADSPDYGNVERSGKLLVVRRVLSLWAEQGHRCLLFCQTQQMLDICEGLLMSDGYNYRRMDGTTPVGHRMRLIDEFNDDMGGVFCFLLTTKVGGLGVNLTGADRVMLFDPDWNPATDSQARERAWRVGQKREVTVYRLITPGTIEEKVYHRQIYKQHLTDRILRDPKQRRVFKAKDLADLFTFDEQAAASGGSAGTAHGGAGGGDSTRLETAELFAHVDAVVRGAATTGAAPAPAGDDLDLSDGDDDALPVQNGSVPDDDNAHILASLFGSNGIARAMDHEAMATAGGSDPRRGAGTTSVVAEAQRVANRASAALAASRDARARADVFVPTWTGRNGTAGAPPGSGGVGVTALGGMPSSSDLLARARARAAAAGAGLLSFATCQCSTHLTAPLLAAAAGQDGVARGGPAQRSDSDPSIVLQAALVQQIAAFLRSRGGRAASEEVMREFNSRLNAAQAAPFKAALRTAASLEREGASTVWILKPALRKAA
jgi:DNA excision repair protein ERCC-6